MSGDRESAFFFLLGGETIPGVFCGVRLCPFALVLCGVRVVTYGSVGPVGCFAGLLASVGGAGDCVSGTD